MEHIEGLPGLLGKIDEYQAFFYSVYGAYKKAERSGGQVIERHYRIGERTIGLRFVGEGLLPYISPAFAHLEIQPEGTPDLQVFLWDSVSSGSVLPSTLEHYFNQLRWYHTGYLDSRHQIKEFTNQRFFSFFHWGPHILSVLDLETNLGCYWIEDAAQLPFYERAAPLRALLGQWFAGQGIQFVHGAAVGLPERGVLITGKSGVGKSTTSLVCLQAGLVHVSDDYCLVTTGSKPYVHSVYNAAKLKGTSDMARFPKMVPFLHNADRLDEEWGVLFLHEGFPDQTLAGFPLYAILVPELTDNPTTSLRPTSPARALGALAPTTLFQLPGAGSSAMKAMARLVRQVPCYALELGTEVERIPTVIHEFLREAEAGETA
jgi:hypothetical protein